MFDINDGGLLAYLTRDGSTETAYILWTVLIYGIVCAAAYLLGGINTAIIVSRIRHHDDVRTHGSGNAGLTNMFRTYGATSALLTLAGDMLKTVLAVCIGGIATGFMYLPYAVSISPGCYLAGLFCVIGHVFPVYYHFRGGKGVLATATVALVLTPLLVAILCPLFCAIVALSKFISLGSVATAMLYPVALNGLLRIMALPEPLAVSFSTMLMAILIVGKHLPNLKRISEGKENKFSFHKKKEPQKSDTEEQNHGENQGNDN